MDQSDGNGADHSNLRISRYREIEREADVFGRIIGVRRLKPSEQTKIDGFTPELSGHNILEFDVFDDDGKPTGEKRKQYISHRSPMIFAASVCEIDHHPLVFPRSRQELDANYDMLDGEGIAAAAVALARLMRRTEFPFEQTKEMAKNSQGTSFSDFSAGASEMASPTT
jgi:hypothetical protein